MKRLIITVVLAYFLPFCYAQTNYYYANNERNYWLEDSTSVNIIVSDSEQYDMIVGRILEIFSDKTDTVSYVGDDDNIIIISEKLRTIPIERLTSTICNNSSDISFITYAKRVNRQRIWLRNEINVYGSGTRYMCVSKAITSIPLTSFLSCHNSAITLCNTTPRNMSIELHATMRLP